MTKKTQKLIRIDCEDCKKKGWALPYTNFLLCKKCYRARLPSIVFSCSFCEEPYHKTRVNSLDICPACHDSSTVRGMLVRLKRRAASRKIPVLLTRKDVCRLLDEPCVYCGAGLKGLTLDRIDSDGAYAMGNVVPCCGLCNLTKRSLSVDAFVEHACIVSSRREQIHRLVALYSKG